MNVRARNLFKFDFEPKVGGVSLGWGTYVVGEDIDGSKSNLKAWAHALNKTDAVDIQSSVTTSSTLITTASAHGLLTGDYVAIRAHLTNTGINNDIFLVTVLTSTTFTIPYATGTASGTGGKVYPVLWSAAPTPAPVKEIIMELSTDTDIAVYSLLDGFAEPTVKKSCLLELWRISTNNSAARISDVKEFDLLPGYGSSS